ncbi:chromatin remodeling factor subunit [Diplodia corticola]|uniref:Chromatin remodeling factor subunit n=1 Tax=Diplodia corticola TaxID=236234 RepID=A0A1J9RNX8_9PEZI|nr:chromatin remodeling factor subunit [Diplodia corticola]OJD30183.1 chromatin remodeling factor subunit [Diplodia corticola]
MSAEYKGQDINKLAEQAEQNLNSHALKTGHDNTTSARHGQGASISTEESGVDVARAEQFPGGEVRYGSAATGREIPVEDGGSFQKGTGRPTKDYDFEGLGGPEDKARQYREENPGNADVFENVRQAPGREPKA